MKLRLDTRALILSISVGALVGCIAGHNTHRIETVNISVEKEGSHEVLFASSLDGFRPRQAERQPDGRWMVTAPADREFSYFFLVDGNHYIPSCRLKEDDGYGHENCIHSPRQ